MLTPAQRRRLRSLISRVRSSGARWRWRESLQRGLGETIDLHVSDEDGLLYADEVRAHRADAASLRAYERVSRPKPPPL